MKKILAIAILMMATAGGLNAQSADKMGSDPESCAKYNSLYSEPYKQGNFTEAIYWWRLALQTCPASYKNLYIRGAVMFQTRIENESDPRKKSSLVDSLLWVYDQRILYFGDDAKAGKGYILGEKGVDLQKYRSEDYPSSYKILGESISIQGSQSPAKVILSYMRASQQLYHDGANDAETVMNDYEKCMDIVDANLKLHPEDTVFILTRDQVESYFTNSGAATCEALSKLFSSKFAALKEDIEWLRKITRQLRKTGCTPFPLFFPSGIILSVADNNINRFLHRIARVDNDRKVPPYRKLYLQRKDLLLNLARRPVVKIIDPNFTNRNDLRMA